MKALPTAYSCIRLSSTLAENLGYAARLAHYSKVLRVPKIGDEHNDELDERVEPSRNMSVWPAASSLRSSVAPLPARMDARPTEEHRHPFKSGIEFLKLPKFLHLAPKHIRRQNEVIKRRWIRQQFREVMRNGGEEKAKELLDKLLRSEAVENADLFLEELVHDKLAKRDYGGAFSSWARYATLERTIAGADQLLEYILREQNDIQSVKQTRIKGVCERIQHLFTPADAFAECISAYLVNDRYEEAKILATFYVITPRSFIRPIRRLADKPNPHLIELFSRLFREIYAPPVKQIKKKPQQLTPTEAESENDEQSTEPVGEDSKVKEEPIVLEDPKVREAKENVKFLLQTRRYKKHKYVANKPKLKKYEVDPRQLDILTRIFDEIKSEIKPPVPPIAQAP